MFRLTVRDRLMVAHSLPDPFFGPAQQLQRRDYVASRRLTPAADEQCRLA